LPLPAFRLGVQMYYCFFSSQTFVGKFFLDGWLVLPKEGLSEALIN